MSLAGFEDILFQIPSDEDLSDIQFLAIKAFNEKIRFDRGVSGVAGILATLTANIGKDMYIARAKISIIYNSSANTVIQGTTVNLKLNGIIFESGIAEFGGNNTGNQAVTYTAEYEFKNIGHKVLEGETIELDATVIDNGVVVDGFIECFEENTGTSPQI